MTCSYDPGTGRLASVSMADGSSAAFEWDAEGRLARLVLPGGLERSFRYYADGLLAAMTQTSGGESENFRYAWDAAGRLTLARSEKFALRLAYDTGGRLIEEARSGEGAYRKRYEYDANDNRTRVQSSGNAFLNSLNFRAGMPDEIVPLDGRWEVADGRLRAEPAAGGSARTALDLGDDTGSLFALAASPEMAAAGGGAETFFGLIFGETAGGRYAVGPAAWKESDPESGGEILRYRLKLAWINAEGSVETKAQTAPRPWPAGGAENIPPLAVEIYVGAGLVTAAASNDDGAPTLVFESAALAGTGWGLEARGGSWLLDSFEWVTVVPSEDSRYEYDSMNRLLRIESNLAERRARFEYDALGLLTRKVAAAGTTGFEYDRLDRLTSVAFVPAGGVAQPPAATTSTYSYYGPTWMRRSAAVSAGGAAPAVTSYLYDGFACVMQATVAGGAGVPPGGGIPPAPGATVTHYAVAGSEPLWEVVFSGGGAG
ncbi:MAG: RHS repeat protein, partial [Planctomycetota bacterium]|nr:RHS repeat protein [Planctomycetota bacterium]